MTNSYSGNDDRADASTGVLRTESNWSSDTGGTNDIKENVTEKAGEVVDQVKQQANTQFDSQKGRVSETLGSVALAIRQTGTQLHEQDKAEVAQYADKAAEQIERLSTYMRNADMRQITSEIERFARRQPALFLGGALVLGIFGARFLKSSSHQGSQNWENYPGYTGSMSGYQGYPNYTDRSMGGYSYSGSSSAGVSAGAGTGVSAGSPYIDRSDGANYMDQGGASGEDAMSGDTNVRQRTWTGTSLEES